VPESNVPDWKTEVRQRLAGLRLAPAREAEITEELAQHLEDRCRELRAGGASEAEAARRTRAELNESGSLARELHRVERQVMSEPIVLGTNRRNKMIADLWQDLRYGARMLRKNPGFTLIAMLTLALGIGANAAIFSVVNAVLLRPLAFSEPERLLAVGSAQTHSPGVKGSISYPDFFDWRERNRSLAGLAVYQSAALTLTGTDAPANLTGQIVSAELFEVLGASPHLGRVFTRAEETPGGGASYAAIISYGLWQQRFGADPQVIGRQVTLDRKPFEIVGVMKPGFQFPIQAEPIEVWVTPAMLSEAADGKRPVTERRGYRGLQAVARLRDGVSLKQAQADLSAVAAGLEKEHPDNNTGYGALLIPLHRDLTGDYRQALLVVFAAVACVLLIACANLANLQLARATARGKEMAVRSALGASRARIMRQLLTESVLLALGGGLLGLLLAWSSLEALLRFLPADLPRLGEIAVNPQVLAFAFAVSLLTGIVFGLAPAWQAAKIELSETLKDGARGASAGSGKARLRGALVVAEVALALVLLVSAGLLLQTFRQLQRVNLGFDARNVLTAELAFSETEYAEPEQKIAFAERALERLQTLPGVVAASAIMPLPLGGSDVTGSFQFEGRPAERGSEPTAQLRWVGLNYYATMKIPFLAGRDFSARDDLKAAPAAIVNQAFVTKYLPNEDPLGQRLQLPFGARGDATTVSIIGVVQDVRHRTELRQAQEPELYLPYAQLPFFNQMSLVMRTSLAPASLAGDVQRAVTALDREAVLSNVKTLEQYLGQAVAQPRFSALLFGLFALLALALGAVGLYGVMAYSVTQRRQEIGIRLALGAQTRDVLRLIITQGLRLALLGVALGVAAALALTRLLKALLFGVSAHDPLTFIVIALLLVAVALLACWIPARRAMKVDPLAALRCE
jgi:putative ABC transport system permease protein